MFINKLLDTDRSTPQDTFFIILPSVCSVILSTICTNFLFKLSSKNIAIQFLFEFFCIVASTVFSFTIFSNSANTLSIIVLFVCVLSILYIKKSSRNNCSRKVESSVNNKFVNCLTNVRALINMMTVVAILAVDFNTFSRRLSKTTYYGYSLMDVGVGLFMFANGIVDNGQIKANTLKNSIPLLLLGIGRFILTKLFNYHVSVGEYGVHWNFFLTLFVCKVIVTLLFLKIHIRYIWINAIVLIISYEILLEVGLKHFISNNYLSRDNFLTANKEGIFGTIGYISLYLLSASYGYWLNLKNEQTITAIKKQTFFVASTFFIFVITASAFGTSRRLVNCAYCFWILFIGASFTQLLYIFDKILFKMNNNRTIQPPFICNAINFNGLVFFLVSNVLTGLVNIIIDNTHKIGAFSSIVILLTYMFVNCLLVGILYRNQIRIKV